MAARNYRPQERGAKLVRLLANFEHVPSLAFYPKLDIVGASLCNEFPDWQRDALSLALWNKKTHRLLQMGHRGFTYSCEWPTDEHTEFEFLSATLLNIVDQFNLKSFKQIKLGAAFVQKSDLSFDRLREKTYPKLLAQNEDLIDIFGQINDYAFVAENTIYEKIRCTVRTGPMVRQQLLEMHQSLSGTTIQGEKDQKAFNDFIPSTFIYVAMDFLAKSIDVEDLSETLKQIHLYMHGKAGDICTYLME